MGKQLPPRQRGFHGRRSAIAVAGGVAGVATGTAAARGGHRDCSVLAAEDSGSTVKELEGRRIPTSGRLANISFRPIGVAVDCACYYAYHLLPW